MESLAILLDDATPINTQFIIWLVVGFGLLLLTLHVFAALSRRWTPNSDTPRAMKAEAKRLARRGEHTRAGDLYRGAGEDDLAVEQYKAAGLLHKAAEVVYARGRFAAAAALWERAEVWEPAAEAYRHSGEFKRADFCFGKAGKKLLAARMWEEAGETLKAAQLYRDIQKIDRAAELFEKLGRSNEAAELYEKLYFLAAAGVRDRMGGSTKDEVRKLETKVVELRRKDGELEKLLAFYLRAGLFQQAGDLALELGNADKATELFLRAGREDRAAVMLEDKGEFLRASKIRGDLALRQNELRNAARHYEAAAEMRLAAEVYERLGEDERAAEAYEKAGDPGQAAHILGRIGQTARAANLYEEAGDLDAALRCWESLKDETKKAAVLLRAGRFARAGNAFLRMGRIEDAIAALQKIGSADPEAGEASALLAIALFEKRQYKLALERLDAALVRPGAAQSLLAPLVEVNYVRARCLETMGEMERATEAYERVLAIDYEFRDAAERLIELKRPTDRTRGEDRGASASSGEVRARLAAGGAGAGTEVALATPPPHPGNSGTLPPFRSGGRPADLSGADRGEAPPPTRARSGKLGEGRYKIIEEVGRGGMGVVYRCEDTLLGRIVAYKVLSSQIRDFPAAFENFLREAQSAARLNHPNIVTVYDFGESDGGYYMTLEYVAGKTLRQYVKSGPAPEELRSVLMGIREGLAYAHSQNVVHRDIKPSNILISDIDLKAKILDFGLAKILEDVADTASGVLGTPWYMSPEQVLGGQIDPRTDLYSLGVTLFEVLSGELPFRGRDFGYHHVHTAPPSPRAVNPKMSEDLDAIILKCMQKKPEDRFLNAEAVREAVRVAKM